MKQVQKWVSEDGEEFNSKEACADHERLCGEVHELQSLLKKRPNMPGCAFENGAGFVQQTESAYWAYRKALTKIAARFSDHKWIKEDGPDVHESYAGRIISECCPSVVWRAWSRVSCIDKQFREWGQPYFANHPEKATQVKLG